MGQDLPSALWDRLIETSLMRAQPGRTLSRVLASTQDQESRVDALVPILMANPLYESSLLGLNLLGDRVKRWSVEEEQNPARRRVLLERTVSLLGRAATRNVVACVRMNRMSGAGLSRKKSQTHAIDPHAQLRFAILAESYCEEHKMPFPGQAYLAGLHYDWLNALFAAQRAPAEARTSIDAVWAEGFLVGRVAFAIGSLLKNFKYGKVVFAAGTLLPIGKLLMFSLFPKGDGKESWAGFVAGLDKKNLKPGDRALSEELIPKTLFPLDFPELSALFVGFFDLFPAIEKSIRYHRQPAMLEKIDPNLFLLARLLNVSASIARLGPAAIKGDTPIPLNPAQRRFFTENRIGDAALAAALRQVFQGRSSKEGSA